MHEDSESDPDLLDMFKKSIWFEDDVPSTDIQLTKCSEKKLKKTELDKNQPKITMLFSRKDK